jgi:hypothetical protein
MSDYSTTDAWGAHWNARDKIPALQESYVEVAHRAYRRNVDGRASRADYEYLSETADQLARLHADEATYYTRMTAQYAAWAAEITTEGNGH